MLALPIDPSYHSLSKSINSFSPSMDSKLEPQNTTLKRRTRLRTINDMSLMEYRNGKKWAIGQVIFPLKILE
jgi:hypothetical protein